MNSLPSVFFLFGAKTQASLFSRLIKTPVVFKAKLSGSIAPILCGEGNSQIHRDKFSAAIIFKMAHKVWLLIPM